MSDSDSDQGFDIEEVPEENQSHVKQILNKGRAIAPFYDDATLFKMFKSYYSVDNLFYQQLQMAAKRMNAKESNDFGWIKVGKTSHTSKSSGNAGRERKQRSQPSERYNFLEDEKLIARAKNFDRDIQNKQRQKERKVQAYKEKESSSNNGSSIKYKEKKQENTQNKRKYQEKTADNLVKNNPQAANLLVGSIKKQKIVEKKQNINTEKTQQNSDSSKKTQVVQEAQSTSASVNQNQTKAVKYAQKVEPQSKNVNTSNVNQAKTNSKNDNSKNVTNNQQSSDSTVKTTKYQEKVVPQVKSNEIKVKESDNKKQAQVAAASTKITEVKKEEVHAKVEVKTTAASSISATNLEKSTSTKSEEVLNPNQVEKQFAKTCQSNTFVLSFVKPSAKLQKVSYIRYPDGKMEQIKIRQVLNQTKLSS